MQNSKTNNNYCDDNTKKFKQFVNSEKPSEIIEIFNSLLQTCNNNSNSFNQPGKQFYEHLKISLKGSYPDLWKILDTKIQRPEYKEEALKNTKVLIVGAGPGGLRTAIECAMLGADVTVIEKRRNFTRNNVLLLWDYTVHELKSLAAKTFYPRFCVGGLHHISIRRLQFVLLKVALLFGVRVKFGVELLFVESPNIPTFPPSLPTPHLSYDDCLFNNNENNENNDNNNNNNNGGDQMTDININVNNNVSSSSSKWYAVCSCDEKEEGGKREERIEFKCIIGADGLNSKVSSLFSYPKQCKSANLAIGITFNFVNSNSRSENLNEFGYVRFLMQKWFKDLKDETNIDLENCTYYRDETHYYVCTATKESLLARDVFLHDYGDDIRSLLSPQNLHMGNLQMYVRDIARHCLLPDHIPFFCQQHDGRPDIQVFDFTKKHYATYQSHIFLPPSLSSLLPPHFQSHFSYSPPSPSSSSSSSSSEDESSLLMNEDINVGSDDNNIRGGSNSGDEGEDGGKSKNEDVNRSEEMKMGEADRTTCIRDMSIFTALVGDALLEPFWPLGTGANRAFLSALDAVYSMLQFVNHVNNKNNDIDNDNDNDNVSGDVDVLNTFLEIENENLKYYQQLYSSEQKKLRTTVFPRQPNPFTPVPSPYENCTRNPYSRYLISLKE